MNEISEKMHKIYSIVLLTLFVTQFVHADTNIDLLLEELGLPKEITLTKRALALASWAKLETEINTQNVEDVCQRTEMLSRKFMQESPEKRKRLDALKKYPEVPLDQCKSVFLKINQQCVDIAREFYVNQFINDSVVQPLVLRVVVDVIYTCPSMRILGYDVDADKILENYKS